MALIDISTLYNKAIGMPESTGTGVLAFTGTAQNYPDDLAAEGTFIIQCTEDCHIDFGGTATTADPFYFASTPYLVHLPAATGPYTASVIRSVSSGDIYISKLTPDRV